MCELACSLAVVDDVNTPACEPYTAGYTRPPPVGKDALRMESVYQQLTAAGISVKDLLKERVDTVPDAAHPSVVSQDSIRRSASLLLSLVCGIDGAVDQVPCFGVPLSQCYSAEDIEARRFNAADTKFLMTVLGMDAAVVSAHLRFGSFLSGPLVVSCTVRGPDAAALSRTVLGMDPFVIVNALQAQYTPSAGEEGSSALPAIEYHLSLAVPRVLLACDAQSDDGEEEEQEQQEHKDFIEKGSREEADEIGDTAPPSKIARLADTAEE